ncbi:MAG: glycosyltransferase family 4 protein [Chthoniobacterales bacterium]
MNILFVLYGGAETNSFIPLTLFARELMKRGHGCAVVIHDKKEKRKHVEGIRLIHPEEALTHSSEYFNNQQKADILHAWTPRQNVVQFVLAYEALFATPLLVYLEDHEGWIAEEFLRAHGQKPCLEKEKSWERLLPSVLSHPSKYRYFLGLADAIATITPSLQYEVPSWVAHETIMLGVDLDFFNPHRPLNRDLKKKLGLGEQEKIIVYCGGINQFTAPAIRSLCQTVLLLRQRGYPCRLLRSGPGKISKIFGIRKTECHCVIELGILPRSDLPHLMSLADIFIQPGRPTSFEKFRLPSKVPEFMAMGIPSIVPSSNIGSFVQQKKDALVHMTGIPEEMATLCEEIFKNSSLALELRKGARQFAEKHFDCRQKVDQLEKLYQRTIDHYGKNQSALFWKSNEAMASLATLFSNKLKQLLELSDAENGDSKEREFFLKQLFLLEQEECKRSQQIERDGIVKKLIFYLQSMMKNQILRKILFLCLLASAQIQGCLLAHA